MRRRASGAAAVSAPVAVAATGAAPLTAVPYGRGGATDATGATTTSCGRGGAATAEGVVGARNPCQHFTQALVRELARAV